MRTPTFKELHVLLTLAALSAAATLFLLSQSGCGGTFNLGVAEIGGYVERCRFANGGIEADATVFVHVHALRPIFALLNMDKEVLEAIEIMPPRAGVTEGKASE